MRAAIEVQLKPFEAEISWFDLRAEAILQGQCGGILHLVLDGNMQPRLVLVLRRQAAMKMFGNILADRQHTRTFDGHSRTTSKIHQP